MTRETAKRKIKGFPLALQAAAKEDIDNRAYITTELVPVFELESGYYQMTVNYKIRLADGYIYGKGMWAPVLRFHDGIFYVAFSSNDMNKTYLYRSEDLKGPWKRSEIKGFYHDLSMLFDDGKV